jgi:glutamate-1-semialdehyde 2,1-aminomutase
MLTSPELSPAQALYKKAKRLIPGGTQLLSKRPEMFAPERWPSYVKKAKGCRLTDIEGHEYLDFTTMGIGACLLGYNDPDVTEAVVKRVESGSMCTLNYPEEVDLIERLLELHPWASMGRLARTGGEAMTVAVRIARAATGRDEVAFCGYHGWHDWYLASNLKGEKLSEHLLPGLDPKGVPSCLAETAWPFEFNQIDQLESIVKRRAGKLAAVVMEPMRSAKPTAEFVQKIREICDREGILLVIDEITAGWRFNFGGSHLALGYEPDITVFAKALGNGHPIAAIIGRSRSMQAAQETFISSTYWTEGVGPVAALAVLDKMKVIDVPAHVNTIGALLGDGLSRIAKQEGIPLHIGGCPALLHWAFDHPENLALQTLFTVEMLKRDILTSASIYPCWAHSPQDVERYLDAAAIVLPKLADLLGQGKAAIERELGSPVRHTGFSRLN